MPIKDLVAPGFVGTSTIRWIVTRGLGSVTSGFTIADSVAVGETLDVLTTSYRTTSDNVAVSDTVDRVVSYLRDVQDSLAYSDEYAQVVSYSRALEDTLTYSDEFARRVDYYRQISDSIAVIEEMITALNGVVITPPEEEEEEAEALDVEEDLYAWILDCHIVSDLIGTRLYPVEAPQNAARPLIIYEIMTRDRDDTQAGESGLVRMVVQFDIQAASYLEVRLVEEALRRPFYQMMHKRMGTTFVQSAEIADATDSDSPPVFADALGVYHSRIDLELWYEEPEPE